MIARLISTALKRSAQPFAFVSGDPREDPSGETPLGLYVHVPFCTSLCDFCPYFKIAFDREKAAAFVDAVVSEIRQSAGSGVQPVSTVYFGGGTPTLLGDKLRVIQECISSSFRVQGPSGIEVHPNDIRPDMAGELRAAGFTMVSIGIQSFQEHCLRSLGRQPADYSGRVATMSEHGFDVVDVDLIFGIPGQTPADIAADFRIAVESGATQVSTYPFIDFTYAANREKPLGRRGKRQLLDAILEVSDTLGFQRTSVWTFARPRSDRYSSVTRDAYLGFGPSAASLLGSSFSVNVFSVEEYITAIETKRPPTALSVRLSPRERQLFWLFWHCYNLRIERGVFADRFGCAVEEAFGPELNLALRLGIIERHNGAYALTEKGAYRFHLIEQMYTNQYIDRIWRISSENPWPERLVIR